jgi:PTS system fructose-specific IIC component
MRWWNTPYRHLMSGVSSFIPFIVAGGVLISFAFLFDSANASTPTFGTTNPVSAWLLDLGAKIIGLMLPILAGYIAYSIADKPGLLVGMAGGLVALAGGSGFIGAIIAGFAGGYLTVFLRWLTKKLPRSFEGVRVLLVYPIIGAVLIGLAMVPINLLVPPINAALTEFLTNLSTGNAVVLGLVLGAMIAFDMGGPVNKVAYLFAVSTLTTGDGTAVASAPMGMVAAGAFAISGGCALATFMFRRKFSPELRDAGKAAAVMGLTFIGEGAIPFAIAHPTKVIPSIMTGSAVGAGLAALFGITLAAPIGGVFTIPLINNIPLYLLAGAIGTVVAAVMMGLLLKPYQPQPGIEDAVVEEQVLEDMAEVEGAAIAAAGGAAEVADTASSVEPAKDDTQK